jgi:hypothetical protein
VLPEALLKGQGQMVAANGSNQQEQGSKEERRVGDVAKK